MLGETTIIVPHRITREFIQAHREWSFVYSTDYFGVSKQMGQAFFAAGEPNAYGIPVRFRFCQAKNESYFSDNQSTLIVPALKDAIAKIPANMRCSSCGGTSEPLRRNMRNAIVCADCWRHWRFLGPDACEQISEWKIIEASNKPVIVFPKIGEGASRMKEKAPKMFSLMKELLAAIEYKHIKWDYYATA